MKQRIFAVLLVVALLVTVGAFAVHAEGEGTVETTDRSTVYCPCHDGLTLADIDEIAEGEENAWQDWDGTASITANGHYRLTADITAETATAQK